MARTVLRWWHAAPSSFSMVWIVLRATPERRERSSCVRPSSILRALNRAPFTRSNSMVLLPLDLGTCVFYCQGVLEHILSQDTSDTDYHASRSFCELCRTVNLRERV